MQRDSLAHAIDDPVEFVNTMRFHIGDSAGGRFSIEIEVAVWTDDAEGHDLDRAPAPLCVQSYPELTAPCRRRSQVHEDESDQALAEGIEEFNRRTRGAYIISRHSELREERHCNRVVALEQRDQRGGAAQPVLQGRPLIGSLCHQNSQLPT
jgi:hypothetical protein